MPSELVCYYRRMTTSLYGAIFAAILASHTHYYGDPEQCGSNAEHVRFDGIALDIEAVSNSHPIYSGPEAVLATALTLIVVAQHESSFWAAVQDCSRCYLGSDWCDRGKSVTMFQLQGPFARGPYTREQLCNDNRLAAERAASILGRFSKAATPLRMFDLYARGKAVGKPCKAAYEMEAMLIRRLSLHNLDVRWTEGRLTATRVAAKEE
jgi:hypothetical protein